MMNNKLRRVILDDVEKHLNKTLHKSLNKLTKKDLIKAIKNKKLIIELPIKLY